MISSLVIIELQQAHCQTQNKAIFIITFLLSFIFHSMFITMLKIFQTHCQILTEDISFPIKKLIENTLLYIIIDHTKTRKFLLTGLKTKYNILIL